MLIHASCVALDNQAVLLAGKPGSGKSDLALRLIEKGAVLVADDQVLLRREGNNLIASPPPTIAGMIEIRHIGLMHLPFIPSAAVALSIKLTPIEEVLERLPEPESIFLLDHPVQQLRLPAFAASTPAKIRAFLMYKRVDD